MRVYPVVRLNHLSELRFSFQPSKRRLMRIFSTIIFVISQNVEIVAVSLAGGKVWGLILSLFFFD